MIISRHRLAGYVFTFAVVFGGTPVMAQDCPFPGETSASTDKTEIDLYVQGRMVIKLPPWIISRNEDYSAPEELIINRCSTMLTADTIGDSLPERLNIFAYMPDEARASSFVAVSSVDLRMARERTGPYWHLYVKKFPDLRFVGSINRSAHGLVTLDENINSPDDLRGKRVGMITRPSSLRALEEIVLIQSWDVYKDITVVDYLPADMQDALDNGEVDVMFMPVGPVVGGVVQGQYLDLTRTDLRWISITEDDVAAATDNTPVIATSAIHLPPEGSVNGTDPVGLITMDSSWFTFASAPDDVVYEFLRYAQHACAPNQPNCGGRSIENLLRWPNLSSDLMHPGALRFYEEMGAEIAP